MDMVPLAESEREPGGRRLLQLGRAEEASTRAADDPFGNVLAAEAKRIAERRLKPAAG